MGCSHVLMGSVRSICSACLSSLYVIDVSALPRLLLRGFLIQLSLVFAILAPHLFPLVVCFRGLWLFSGIPFVFRCVLCVMVYFFI